MWRDEWLDKDEAEEDNEVKIEAVARLSVQSYLLNWFYSKQ